MKLSEVHFLHWSVLSPFNSFSSTMDLDGDYYSSRCKDINGLSVCKGTFMMFLLGGQSDH